MKFSGLLEREMFLNYWLNNMNAEVLSFDFKRFQSERKKIKDLDFPRASIVGGVIRDGVGMIALGILKYEEGTRY